MSSVRPATGNEERLAELIDYVNTGEELDQIYEILGEGLDTGKREVNVNPRKAHEMDIKIPSGDGTLTFRDSLCTGISYDRDITGGKVHLTLDFECVMVQTDV